MRLWHEDLIKFLPRQQLLGQNRECCALRGNGWGKPHSVVNYVFKHSPMKLYVYHMKVIHEMHARGYSSNIEWFNPQYRGLKCSPWKEGQLTYNYYTDNNYSEHDDDYLNVCLNNLKAKGIEIKI